MGSLADIVSGLIGGGAAAGVATGAAPAQKYSAPGIEKTGFEERSSRGEQQVFKQDPQQAQVPQQQQGVPVATDRKSTRLNSQSPMYLVCRLLLEKKKTTE